jgi:hypothetical protein
VVDSSSVRAVAVAGLEASHSTSLAAVVEPPCLDLAVITTKLSRLSLYLLFTALLLTVCFERFIHYLTTKQMTVGFNASFNALQPLSAQASGSIQWNNVNTRFTPEITLCIAPSSRWVVSDVRRVKVQRTLMIKDCMNRTAGRMLHHVHLITWCCDQSVPSP